MTVLARAHTNTFGCDPDEISSKYINQDNAFYGKDYFVTSGMQTIANNMASTLSITYNKAVTNIDYSNPSSAITLTCSDSSTYTCDRLIITVPLGVL